MKVILKHGHCRHEGTKYSAGDEIDVSEYFYNAHKTRFEKAAKAVKATPKTEVVITNDEPEKTKSKKAAAGEKRTKAKKDS